MTRRPHLRAAGSRTAGSRSGGSRGGGSRGAGSRGGGSRGGGTDPPWRGAPTRPRPLWWRPLVVGVLVVEAVVGLVSIAVALLSALAFFGQTSGDVYRAWAFHPVALAGAALVVLAGTAGALLLLPLGRRHPLAVLSSAVALGAAAFAAGQAVHAARLHEQPVELAAVRRLAPPTGATDVQTTVGSEPPDVVLPPELPFGAVLRAGHLAAEPPVAVRSWRAPPGVGACTGTERAIAAWVDPGSVRPRLVDGSPCSWTARHGGWPVVARLFERSASGDYWAVVVLHLPLARS